MIAGPPDFLGAQSRPLDYHATMSCPDGFRAAINQFSDYVMIP